MTTLKSHLPKTLKSHLPKTSQKKKKKKKKKKKIQWGYVCINHLIPWRVNISSHYLHHTSLKYGHKCWQIVDMKPQLWTCVQIVNISILNIWMVCKKK
jgi:hypothetical protein